MPDAPENPYFKEAYDITASLHARGIVRFDYRFVQKRIQTSFLMNLADLRALKALVESAIDVLERHNADENAGDMGSGIIVRDFDKQTGGLDDGG